MPKKRIIQIAVSEFPIDATDTAVANFVYEALSAWGGSYQEANVLDNGLDVISVKIGKITYKVDYRELKHSYTN